MRGIVVFYIDIHPEFNQDIQQTIDIVLKANAALIEKINKDSEYQVMVVPTTKEACRAEKIDFDKPYPRFLPKTHIDVVDFEKKKADRDAQRERERQDAERIRQKKIEGEEEQ
jgi:hypothetical protein